RCRAKAQERKLPLGLYLDIAVGVRTDGFDAWCDQDAVLSGMAVGAPPDALNTAGQNWGLVGFNPAGVEERQFEPFRHMLAASMRYAGAIRLDHVLGLKRLYLIPHGVRASQGAYVRFPFEAMLAVAALSSMEYKCIVVGEDLGTVPENFRETLAEWGIWTYQVMLFERSGSGAFFPPESYRENALVSFGTHDVATFAGWRELHDLAVKRALGMDAGETDEQRHGAFDALRHALQQHGLDGADFASVARYLADTRSRLLVVSMEDVLGLRDQVNLPGTTHEHPNWRRRLPVVLEELKNQPGLSATADIMRSAGRSVLPYGAGPAHTGDSATGGPAAQKPCRRAPWLPSLRMEARRNDSSQCWRNLPVPFLFRAEGGLAGGRRLDQVVHDLGRTVTCLHFTVQVCDFFMVQVCDFFPPLRGVFAAHAYLPLTSPNFLMRTTAATLCTPDGFKFESHSGRVGRLASQQARFRHFATIVGCNGPSHTSNGGLADGERRFVAEEGGRLLRKGTRD